MANHECGAQRNLAIKEMTAFDSERTCKGMMRQCFEERPVDAVELWARLKSELTEETSRVAHQCEPVGGSARDLLELLDDRKSCASIANDKLAYSGNPYEQLGLDFVRILACAERISGQKPRPKWERI
jgi:hypothetical protein